MILRKAVHNGRGQHVGYLEYAATTKNVLIGGAVFVPREYLLRLEGVEDDPAVTVSFRVEGGAPVVTNVTVDGGDIGPQVFKNIANSLRLWSDYALQRLMLKETVEEGGSVLTPEVSSGEKKAALAEVHRPRKYHRITDELLGDVAAMYTAHADEGTVYAAIMEKYDRPMSTVSRWVGEARKAGLVPPATKGVPKGPKKRGVKK